MASRTDLHEVFCEILGTRNAYFQPPSTVQMSYPAIRYKRKKIDNKFANNNVYMQFRCYEVTVIDYDPESRIVDLISQLQQCSHDRQYVADNLNHDVFTIYY